jgi:hypothetical protein
MLVWLVQTDEGVQPRLSNEHKPTAPSFAHRDKWSKHENCGQQITESQFHSVCVIILRNSHSMRVVKVGGRMCIKLALSV